MKRAVLILAAIASLPSAAQAAEPLGRLFFTPAQRNTLDAGKQLDLPRKAGPVLQGPRSLTVNGMVTRSDGESTVWVNGSPANAPRGAGNAPIYAKPSGSVDARVRVLESESKLRVGQTLDRRTGKVTESYERKQAPVHPDATEKNGASVQPHSDTSTTPKEKSAAN